MGHPAALEDCSRWLVSTTDGGCRFRWRRTADGGVLAEWVGLLGLRVDPSGHVEASVPPGADPLFANKLFRTGAAAFVRALRGQTSLHASAVARAEGALVCVGESGAGKSTAAATLCERDGFELLADDVVALADGGGQSPEWSVLPTESVHWLRVDPAAPKRPIQARSSGDVPRSLRAIVSLRRDDRVAGCALRRLRGAEVYALLASSALRFELTHAVHKRELDVFASIAASVRIYGLERGPSATPEETATALLGVFGRAS